MIGQASSEIRHPCLQPGARREMRGGGRTDEERIAILLEAAALLSHLRVGGWSLPDGWAEAGVSPEGRLVGVQARPSPGRLACRELLEELVSLLFASTGEVAGRGRARRAIRIVARRWRWWWGELDPDDAVGHLFEAAPFLWKARFRAHRDSLRAIHLSPAGERVRQAGPRRLAGEPSGGDVATGIGSRTRIPADTVASGGVAGELAALYAGGRWRAVLARADEAMRANETTASDLAFCAAGAAVRVGETRRALRWARRAEPVERSRLLEAWVRSRQARLEELPRLAELLPSAAPSGSSGLAWVQTAAVLGSCRRAKMLLRSALGRRGDVLEGLDRGRAWIELGRLRLLEGSRSGARRALLHAHRRLRWGSDDALFAESLAGLVELDLRQGRRCGGAEAIGWVERCARAGGDSELELRTHVLRVRLEMVAGRADAALERSRRLLDRSGRPAWLELELGALMARAAAWLGCGDEAAAQLERLPARALDRLEPEERPVLWAMLGQGRRAAASAAAMGWRELWPRLLEGEVERIPASLGVYRRSRLVHDLFLLVGDVVPWRACRQAERWFRAAECAPFAERLAPATESPWRALRSFLETPRVEPNDVAELIARSGYDEVSLDLEGPSGDSTRLVAGSGGECEMAATMAGGCRLVLRAPQVGDGLACLLRVGAARVCGRETAERSESATGGLVGRDPGLARTLRRAQMFAPGDMPVLVLGETGTGKELLSRRVHDLSRRAQRPFVPVNCAGLSEGVLLSELFGHVRGAFTGADRDRAGVFEDARGGTVFLDEIGDLPLSAQGSLLRVLQDGEVRRVGESRPRSVDVRVVAATHRDLAAMVREGSFRSDLYYRLKAAQLELPPLRERGGDVLLLARHFLLVSGRRIRLTESAERALLSYNWPGNVRELRNVVEVAALLSGPDGAVLDRHLELPRASRPRQAPYHEALEAERARLVRQALAACGGRRARAARQLGITPQALSYLVRRLQLS